MRNLQGVFRILLEFNGVLSCTGCFKSKIQSMAEVLKR
jgi:hypothetical protein